VCPIVVELERVVYVLIFRIGLKSCRYRLTVPLAIPVGLDHLLDATIRIRVEGNAGVAIV